MYIDSVGQRIHVFSGGLILYCVFQQNESLTESSPAAVLSMAQGCEIFNKFQALYRSSLICPNCGKQSNTYESYLCLSLPVPQRCLRPVYITVVYLDDDPKQLRIALEMSMFETVKELREKLAFELDVVPKRVKIFCLSANQPMPFFNLKIIKPPLQKYYNNIVWY